MKGRSRKIVAFLCCMVMVISMVVPDMTVSAAPADTAVPAELISAEELADMSDSEVRWLSGSVTTQYAMGILNDLLTDYGQAYKECVEKILDSTTDTTVAQRTFVDIYQQVWQEYSDYLAYGEGSASTGYSPKSVDTLLEMATDLIAAYNAYTNDDGTLVESGSNASVGSPSDASKDSDSSSGSSSDSSSESSSDSSSESGSDSSSGSGSDSSSGTVEGSAVEEGTSATVIVSASFSIADMPDRISVVLYQDGAYYRTATLSSSNDYYWVLTGLDLTSHYSIEAMASGYDCAVAEQSFDGSEWSFLITVTASESVTDRGQFTIRMTNADGNELSGGKIHLQSTDSSVGVSQDVTVIGEATISNLPYGSYRYYETTAPTGYAIDTGVYSFNLLSGNDVVTQTLSHTEAEDTSSSSSDTSHEGLGRLKITLVDSKDYDEVLEGGYFDIYGSNKNTVIASDVTDDDGVVEFWLEPGTYYYQESDAPDGYRLNSAKKQFKIQSAGQTISVRVTNVERGSSYYGSDGDGNFTILKTDSETGEPLSGAYFRIYQSGSIIDSGSTNSSGEVYFDLDYGSYSYQEYRAPSGYQLDTTKHSFSISSSNYNVIVEVENVPIESSSSSGSSSDTVTYSNSETMSSGGSSGSSSGSSSGGGSSGGSSSGNGSSGFSGGSNDGITVVTGTVEAVPNEIGEATETSGRLIVSCVSDDGTAVAGAAFNIFDEDGNRVYSGTTGTDGRAIFHAEPGTYTVVQTSAPAGYLSDGDERSITVQTGMMSSLEFTDVVDVYAVNMTSDGNPKTGDGNDVVNAAPFIISGCIMFLFAGIFFVLEAFRRKRAGI